MTKDSRFVQLSAISITIFQNAVSSDKLQNVNECMLKFKGSSSMKQYIKKKPIKWCFKVWHRCAGTTGYLYQLELYLGKKDEVKLNLGERVALKLCKI